MGLLSNKSFMKESESFGRGQSDRKAGQNAKRPLAKTDIGAKSFKRTAPLVPSKNPRVEKSPVLGRAPRTMREPNEPRERRSTPVRFFALGGLNEIGKNLYVYECSNDMFIVDCGVAFPDEEMFGVDLVVPDFTYLEKQPQETDEKNFESRGSHRRIAVSAEESERADLRNALDAGSC